VTDDPKNLDSPRYATFPARTAADQAVRSAVRFWWISVLRGSLALLLGLGALLTGVTQQVLVNYIAVYWLLGGLLTVKWALGVRWKAGSRLGLAAGTLAIGTGVLLLARHALSAVVSAELLLDIVGATTLATGALRLVGAFEIEEHTAHRWTIGGVILGATEIAIGLVLLLVQDADAAMLRTTIGIWGLAAGSLLLMQGVRLLRAGRADR